MSATSAIIIIFFIGGLLTSETRKGLRLLAKALNNEDNQSLRVFTQH